MSKPNVAKSAAMPRHVAIVMDGNGRWAKKRFLPRFFGHKAGVDSLVKIVQACIDRDIQHLTVFAFSSENWKRSTDEVSGLMGLVLAAVSRYLARIGAMGVRIRIVGDRDAVSEKLRKAWDHAEALTQNNTRIHLSVAFNYGGRWDIAQAAAGLAAKGMPITEASLHAAMGMSHVPDPDLIIRTGGEMRISNFLLWQAAYSELFFSDRLWPDFDEAALDEALDSFQSRERRFGKTSEQIASAHRDPMPG